MKIYMPELVLVKKCLKPRHKSHQPPEPHVLAKGQMITQVRESDDVCQAIHDRLCNWPTGDEILALLAVLHQDQIAPSWVPPPNLPPQIYIPPPPASEVTFVSTIFTFDS